MNNTLLFRHKIWLATALISLGLLGACNAEKPVIEREQTMNSNLPQQAQHVVLNVVTFNYTKTAIFDVYYGRMWAGGAGPLGGGSGIIANAQFPLGEQTLTWRDAGAGETFTAKNKLFINNENIPAGTRYVGVHIYPDETAELTFANGLPQPTERGEKLWDAGEQ